MSYRGEQKIKGKIYVYEVVASWNPIKQRSDNKRVYVGTKDSETGEFMPNKKFYELQGGEKPGGQAKANAPSVLRSLDYGNVYLLDQITKAMELDSILRGCFPETWEEILTCAWHIICENEPLYLCEGWAEASFVPVAPSSQRISKLLRQLDEDRRMLFYKEWASLRSETEYLALDITSISSWSRLAQFVEYGYNRDREDLPQVNLAMLFGEKSRLPVFCRAYPGSIKDVSTLTGIVTFIERLELKRMHFVMDKGFYNAESLGLLLEQYIKFAIGVPFTTSLAKDSVLQCSPEIASPSNAIEVDGHIYYAKTLRSKMNDRRIYIHVYFDEERMASERSALMKKVLRIEAGIADGSISETARQAKEYFSLHKTKSGKNIHRREDVISDESKRAGYFVILTNDSKDPEYVLGIYRLKDAVEKAFDDIKNDLDLERLRIHSDSAMEGRIFIGFLSLIIMSYAREVMRIKKLYKSYTFHSLLSELKKLKLLEFGNNQKALTELTSKQKAIYKAFEFPLPDKSSV